MHKALLYPASYLLLVYQTHELCAHPALQVNRFRNRTLLLHLDRICVCQHHLQGIVYPDSLVLMNYTVDVPLTLQEMRGHFGGIAVVRSSHAVRCVCGEWKHNALLLLLAIDICQVLVSMDNRTAKLLKVQFSRVSASTSQAAAITAHCHLVVCPTSVYVLLCRVRPMCRACA